MIFVVVFFFYVNPESTTFCLEYGIQTTSDNNTAHYQLPSDQLNMSALQNKYIIVVLLSF